MVSGQRKRTYGPRLANVTNLANATPIISPEPPPPLKNQVDHVDQVDQMDQIDDSAKRGQGVLL